MLVRLNEPPNVANGNIQLLSVFAYYDIYVHHNGHYIATTTCRLSTNKTFKSAAAAVWPPMEFISRKFLWPRVPFGSGDSNRTFFGGNDASWAPPRTTHTYYRNILMWASNAPSNLTGQLASIASHHATGLTKIITFALISVLGMLCV